MLYNLRPIYSDTKFHLLSVDVSLPSVYFSSLRNLHIHVYKNEKTASILTFAAKRVVNASFFSYSSISQLTFTYAQNNFEIHVFNFPYFTEDMVLCQCVSVLVWELQHSSSMKAKSVDHYINSRLCQWRANMQYLHYQMRGDKEESESYKRSSLCAVPE